MQKLLLSSTLLACLAAGPASAQEVTLKAASVAPDGTPWSDLLARIKTRVQAGNKDIKFKIYLGGRLGGEKETARETREGRVQFWGGSTAALATLVPELYILEAPYLFESDAEAYYVLDNHARPLVEKLLEKQGFVMYQFAENGWHGLAMKSGCVEKLADLKGKKIRSQEAKIHLDTFKAMGANAVEMAVPEVLPALQQGVVDGFSNTPLFSFATSWHQAVTGYTDTSHIYQPGILVYSKKFFDAQSKETQALLLSNIKEDEKYGRDGVGGIRKGLLDNFANSGVKVCQPSAALTAELKKATAGVFKTYRDAASKEGKALADALVAGKKAFAALPKK